MHIFNFSYQQKQEKDVPKEMCTYVQKKIISLCLELIKEFSKRKFHHIYIRYIHIYKSFLFENFTEIKKLHIHSLNFDTIVNDVKPVLSSVFLH